MVWSKYLTSNHFLFKYNEFIRSAMFSAGEYWIWFSYNFKCIYLFFLNNLIISLTTRGTKLSPTTSSQSEIVRGTTLNIAAIGGI